MVSLFFKGNKRGELYILNILLIIEKTLLIHFEFGSLISWSL